MDSIDRSRLAPPDQLNYDLARRHFEMEIEGERTVVRKDDVIFIPPGVEHAIYNTGMVDLRFIVVTSPPDE